MRALKPSRLIMLLILLPLLITAAEFRSQARWGQNNKYSWGREAVRAFHPSDIAWTHYFNADYGVECDSGGSEADSGNVVFFWLDQTANNYNGAQGTNANRPIFRSDVNNCNNGITFDSNDDYLIIPNNDDLKELTYLFVLSSTESMSAQNVIIGHRSNTSYVGSFHLEYSGGLNLFGNDPNNLRTWNADSKTHDGNPHIYMLYIAGSDQSDILDSEFLIDGIKQGINATNSSGAPSNWNNLFIGRQYGLYGGFTISEFAVYEGKISEADRINLQNYWRKKYRIEP